MMFITKRFHCSRIKQVLLVLATFCTIYYINIQSKVSISHLPIILEDLIPPDCVIPELDPYSMDASKYVQKQFSPIVCEGKDWVKCYHSKCKVVESRLQIMTNISCLYYDIIYESDKEYVFGTPIEVKGGNEYTLVNSDHVRVSCTGLYRNGSVSNWTYYSTGFREFVDRKPPSPSQGNNLNILILMFDSTSRIGFIRNLPETYRYIVKELNGVVLNGYNIVGDGTPGALFPILSGNFDYELPDVRIDTRNNRSLDTLPFIFYNLKNEGYRTAYLEDMPWIGTFQYKFNGFKEQPTDHYLRAFFTEEALRNNRVWRAGTKKFCVGDTPQYQLMLHLTDQFLLLDGKRFCLTLIADLTHDSINMLSIADEPILNFFQTLKKRQQFQNTLVFVMGDHGPRFGKIRNTLEGRLEERLPFVCVILPEELKKRSPGVQAALEVNANRWTTPFDIHATMLDALDMPQYMNKYKVFGSNIPRAMSLLRPISLNRSCGDAGIEPHWCTCLVWKNLSSDDPFYDKVAFKLMRYINLLTEPVRDKCAVRTLIAIDWVKKQQVNKELLTLRLSVVPTVKDIYQVRIVTAPRRAIYEASMTYVNKIRKFLLEVRHISRINSYGNESRCVRDERPNLSMYCYCNDKRRRTG